MRHGPERFGPYRVLRRLGVGGMAETFVAVREGPGGFEQEVCLKRILPAFDDDPDFVELFMREAAIAAALRHANVVGVLDFGDVDGTHYMALELVDGLDLKALLRALPGRRLDPDLVALLAMDLAHALQYAHGREGKEAVIHRDLSPSNVLLSRAGEVKLADFGIAKATTATVATASAVVKGKIPYMSPEQMRAEPLDGRSDLFSLGVLLYEAAAGRRPFDGATEVQTMTRILAGEHDVLGTTRPDVPGPLVAVVERLLATRADDRYASAADLIDALAPLVPPPTARRRLGAFVRDATPVGSREARLATAETAPADSSPPTALPASSREAEALLALDPPEAPGEDLHVESGASLTGSPRETTKSSTPPVGPSAPLAVPREAQRSRARSALGLALLATVAVAVGAIGWMLSSSSEEPLPRPAVGGPVATAALPAPPDGASVESVATPTVATQELATAQPTSQEVGRATAADAGTTRTSAPSTEAEHETERTREPPARAERRPRTDSAERRPATLHVTVFPWGRVWVDGRFMGRAPAEVRVGPGRRRVSVGYQEPQVTEVVTVRAGQTTRVELELPAE